MTTLQPTSPSQWQRGRVEQLPSGNAARLQAITMEYFVRRGHIPDLLTPAIADEAGATEPRTLSREETLRQHMALVDEIVMGAFLEPRVVAGEPGEGEISLLDVAPEDRAYVVNKYSNIITVVEPFRTEQTGNVPNVPVSEGDEPTA